MKHLIVLLSLSALSSCALFPSIASMISGAVENNLASMNKPVRLTSSSVTSTKVAKGYQRSNAVEQKNHTQTSIY
jgi:hypothetical protein